MQDSRQASKPYTYLHGPHNAVEEQRRWRAGTEKATEADREIQEIGRGSSWFLWLGLEKVKRRGGPTRYKIENGSTELVKPIGEPGRSQIQILLDEGSWDLSRPGRNVGHLT